jgi:hypothetical protein
MLTRHLWVSVVIVMFLVACQGSPPGTETPEAASPSSESTAEASEPQASEAEDDEEAEEVEDDEEAEEAEDDEDDSGRCTSGAPHPKGERLAERHDVPYEEIMGWFCAGYGFGEANRAYSLSLKAGMPVEEVFAMREDGLGWGKIKKQLGAKSGGGPPDD